MVRILITTQRQMAFRLCSLAGAGNGNADTQRNKCCINVLEHNLPFIPSPSVDSRGKEPGRWGRVLDTLEPLLFRLCSNNPTGLSQDILPVKGGSCQRYCPPHPSQDG